MRRFFISIASLLSVLVLLLLIAPLFISTDLVKSQVTERVSAATGKSLSIGGNVSISLITGLKLNAEDVMLTEADGAPLLSIGEVDFGLALSPLLNGVVEISRIQLDEPRITLQQSADIGGSGSAGTHTETTSPAPFADANEPAGDPLGGLSPETFRLKAFAIRGGQLVQRQADGSETSLVDDFSLDLSLPALNEPAFADGQFSFRGKSHALALTLANPYDLIRQAGSNLSASLTSDAMKITVDGQAMAPEAMFRGSVNGSAPALSDLVNWLIGSRPDLPVNALTFDSQMEVAGSDIKLLELNGQLDSLPFVAAARVTTDGPKPIIRVALELPDLDVDQLLPKAVASTSEVNTASAQSETSTATSIAGSGPSGVTSIDLSPLDGFDGFVDLRIGTLRAKGQTVHDVVFITRVQDGALTASLKEATLADGTAKLDFSALSLNGIPVLSGSADLAGLDAAPLLALAQPAGLAIKGRLSANASFQTSGTTSSALMKALDLNANLRMHDASVDGVGQLLGNPEADRVSNLDVTASVTSLTSPVRLDGALTWNGERVALDMTADPRPLLDGQPTEAQVSVKSRPIWLRYNGRVDPTGDTLVDGKTTVSADSLKRLLGWVGQATSDGTPDGDLSLTSQVAMTGQTVRLTQTNLTFGETKGAGDARLVLAGKPDIEARFVFDSLDVTPFLGSGESASQHAQSSQTQSSQAASTSSSGQSSGWNTDPIDFSGLNSVDLSLDVTTRSLKANNIVVGQSQLVVAIKNGVARADLNELSLYLGQGIGTVVVDASQVVPSLKATFDLSGINARPFLRDAADFDSIEGAGDIALDFTSSGASEAQLVSALNGQAAFTFRDGAIVGINVARMMRALTTDVLTGWTQTQTEKTDFSEFGASFVFTNGVARNDDLRLLGPLVRVSGSGTVSMPPRTIDYRVEPKLVANLTGQGGRVGLDGFPVPVIIRGSWDNPQIYPDIKGILTDPGHAFRQLQSLGGSLGSELFKGVEGVGAVGTVVKDVIGGGAENLGDGLGKLLGAATGNGNRQTSQDGQADGQQNQADAPQDQKSIEEEAIRSLGNILFGN